jgi:hypothetical protein
MSRILLLSALAALSVMRDLDEWTRRRAIAWRQWKRGRTRFGLRAAPREVMTKTSQLQ